MRWIVLLALPLIGLTILTQSFIDLEVQFALEERLFNLPIADLGAALLLALGIPLIWKDARRGAGPPLPGPAGYGLFLLASVLSIWVAMEPAESLHHVIRKPLFFYLAYGIGLAWWVARGIGNRSLDWMLLGWAAGSSLISLFSSLDRIGMGDALWHHGIDGLSPNHKALSVALAGGLPLLMGMDCRAQWIRRLRQGVLLLAAVAILASASKTAMLTGALGLGLYWPEKRPLSLRPRLVASGLVVGIALAYYAPLILGSKAMLDAARSRHSLNERALEMFARNPLIGSGSGMGVHYEQNLWPHYRVNGVDTHGVVQKVGSETGLLGLAGYGLFVGSTGLCLIRRRRERNDPVGLASLGTWITLHANLLLSTEALSSTHWIPFAVAWGMAHRIAPTGDANSDGPHLSPPAGR